MITYHHIGGRNGTFPIPVNNVSFSKDVHLILYDADSSCCDQINPSQTNDFYKTSIFPYCIGSQTKRSTFTINFHPTTSSLYKFNEEYADYTFVNNPIYGEYRLGDACQAIKQIPIELITLEDALQKSGIQQIDYLSIDAQGAEFDIIAGSKELIKQHCLGIQLEVEFAKIYQDQKSFFDIHQLMSEMGFELINLDHFGRFAPNSTPIGFRGKEQLLYAEAIYIKKLSLIAKENDASKIYKWALFSLINNNLGWCIEALKLLQHTRIKQDASTNTFAYVDLLNTIWSLYKKSARYRLPSISELFSTTILHGFYAGIPNNDAQFDQENADIKKHISKEYSALVADIQQLKNEKESDLELLLTTAGLTTVAKNVQENRIKEANTFLQLVKSANSANSKQAQQTHTPICNGTSTTDD